MFVIYKEWEEADYGYGGWKDTSTKYFEPIAVTHDEQKAKDYIKDLEEKQRNSEPKRWSGQGVAFYSYECVEVI